MEGVWVNRRRHHGWRNGSGRGISCVFFFPFLFSSLSLDLEGGWEGGRKGGICEIKEVLSLPMI